MIIVLPPIEHGFFSAKEREVLETLVVPVDTLVEFMLYFWTFEHEDTPARSYENLMEYLHNYLEEAADANDLDDQGALGDSKAYYLAENADTVFSAYTKVRNLVFTFLGRQAEFLGTVQIHSASVTSENDRLILDLETDRHDHTPQSYFTSAPASTNLGVDSIPFDGWYRGQPRVL